MLIAAGCSKAEQPAAFGFELAGHLEDRRIREASGLARSQHDDTLLWVINDRGSKEWLHAIDVDGSRRGEIDVKKSNNTDWEDLASFMHKGQPTIMIADIGDNDAKHTLRTLYFATEPQALKDGKTPLAWQFDYRYPDGARDAESAAIDTDKHEVLILSKRDIPAILYSVPVNPGTTGTVIATRLGAVTSLPQPSEHDIQMAPKLDDWYWQPVGMDISADNRAAVILTYHAVFYYQRAEGQSWLEALNTKPVRVSIGNLRNAEAIAFGDAHRLVYVTGEQRNSPLIRFDFDGVSAP